MSRLTVYKYASMAKAVADAHASELDSGTRTSNDDSVVVAKLMMGTLATSPTRHA